MNEVLLVFEIDEEFEAEFHVGNIKPDFLFSSIEGFTAECAENMPSSRAVKVDGAVQKPSSQLYGPAVDMHRYSDSTGSIAQRHWTAGELDAQCDFDEHKHNYITYGLSLPSEGVNTRYLWCGMELTVLEAGFFDHAAYEAEVQVYEERHRSLDRKLVGV